MWLDAELDAAWLVITSGDSGTGTSGTIAYTVATNTVAASRTATITANGQTHVVTQAAADCTVSLDPCDGVLRRSRRQRVACPSRPTATPAARGASSDAAWLVITSGDSGTGTSGTIAYTVATNTVAASRTATITANGQTHVVTQAAADCEVSLDPRRRRPSTQRAASGSVSVTTNGDACGWSASSDAAWLVITSGDSGTGTSGTIAYTVATNTVAASRDGDDHRERPDPCGDAGGGGLRGRVEPGDGIVRRSGRQRVCLGHDQRRYVRLEHEAPTRRGW